MPHKGWYRDRRGTCVLRGRRPESVSSEFGPISVTLMGAASCRRWHQNQQGGQSNEQEQVASSVHGFGSISRRSTSSKPLIAAVNGGAYGGGVEMLLNCDLVIASEEAEFALPEVKRGVVAAQGGRCFVSRIST